MRRCQQKAWRLVGRIYVRSEDDESLKRRTKEREEAEIDERTYGED